MSLGTTPRVLPPLLVGGALTAALLAAVLFSLLVGAGDVGPGSALRALLTGDLGSPTGEALLFVRLPRAVLGVLVGAALAVAGAVMQLVTRNPLASPQTLGVNGCAALATVASIVVATSWELGLVPAFVGAAVGGAVVLLLSAGGTRGPVVLALAGLALHLLATALVQAFTVLNDAAVDVVFWLNGSLAGAQWGEVRTALPFVVVGLVGVLAATGRLQALSLGPEVVTSLGQSYALTSAGAIGLVTVLAGICVAVAGPIGFIGLIVPHIVRALVGRSPRWELALCAITGAALLVGADTAARLVRWPAETPVGVLTALVGAPVYLLLARRVVRGR
ncbi:iron ABC transporter permease [Microbacterium lacticum]|uniref:iron chelate uptake ABC transporter family permease subunit n=1 Tax=Microbacterium TaxID=33882 RepID=UPI0018B03BE3|nr:iron ABC transporter permease [Microbacterium lacticum]MBG0719444.1 iron ABC transporter permease [Microbacterium paulum]